MPFLEIRNQQRSSRCPSFSVQQQIILQMRCRMKSISSLEKCKKKSPNSRICCCLCSSTMLCSASSLCFFSALRSSSNLLIFDCWSRILWWYLSLTSSRHSPLKMAPIFFLPPRPPPPRTLPNPLPAEPLPSSSLCEREELARRGPAPPGEDEDDSRGP